MTNDLFDQLLYWTSLDAPTGFEEPVLRAVVERLTPWCDSVDIDVRGNVCGTLHGGDANAPAVMLTAHADEIGFMVTSVLPGGYLRFARLGGPTEMVLPGQRVRVLATPTPIEGTIGVKPGHILSGVAARTVPAIDELYIDVGAESVDEALSWGIEPGTPAVFVGALTRTRHPHRVFGKCVDNRAGLLAVLEVCRRLSVRRPAATVYCSIVVEEEIGLRGAEVAARDLDPDVVIALDTVPAGGTPDLRPDELPWTIGAGPLLKVRETRGLSTHGPLRNLFRRVADEQSLPYQLVVDTAGITDATSAQQASGRVAALTLGLARRYSHSAVELLDLRDLAVLIDWTEAALRELTSREQLVRL